MYSLKYIFLERGLVYSSFCVCKLISLKSHGQKLVSSLNVLIFVIYIFFDNFLNDVDKLLFFILF